LVIKFKSIIKPTSTVFFVLNQYGEIYGYAIGVDVLKGEF
jgi:hypothetical protein